jgi:glycosyltransferase involved in cell wall biosynthesis
MMSLLVSVVIPTYNYSRYVIDAIDSVLAQTYQPREIIVVDDGSTDDTRERLSRYSDRIHYLYQTTQGAGAARNAGLRAAQGAYVAFLDSDDLWHHQKLERQMRWLAGRRELGLLASDTFSGSVTAWPSLDAERSLSPRPVSLEELALFSRFATSTVVVRRDCLDAVGMFNADLCPAEDRDLWVRIAARYPVAKLSSPLCWYREHENNISRAVSRMEQSEFKVLDNAFGRAGPLRGRRLLRRKACSRVAYSAAAMYGNSDQPGKAVRRMLRSCWLWPLPYCRDEVKTTLARPKMLLVNLWRWLRRPSAARRTTAPSATLQATTGPSASPVRRDYQGTPRTPTKYVQHLG